MCINWIQCSLVSPVPNMLHFKMLFNENINKNGLMWAALFLRREQSAVQGV